MGELIIIACCLVLNALFAAYEMAFVSIPKSELRALAKTGNKSAQILLRLRDKPERTLSIIQIGISLVGALAATVGGLGAAENLEPLFISRFGLSERSAVAISAILIVVPLTFFSVVIGELVPKSLALRSPRKVVLGGASALFLANRILSPAVSLLDWSTRLILDFFFRRHSQEEALATASIEIDCLSPTHQRYMLNMASIEKKLVKNILLPWDRVTYVKDTDSVEEIAHIVLASGHTRVPVTSYGRVTGVLHTKEFMMLRELGERNWRGIIRPFLSVRPADSALDVLRMMQENRSQLCVVFTQSGEHLGIVTMEDIVEEVIGDIFDEDDDERVRKIFATRTDKIVKPRPEEGHT